MEFLKVDNHPSGCMLCQSVTGPFVVCSAASYNVETVNGPVPVDTPIALCLPTESREGCAGQMARMAGYTPPDVAEQLAEQYRDVLDVCERLEGELAAAKSDRVVPVDQLLKLIGEEERVSAPAA